MPASSKQQLELAKSFRRNPTPAERHLWSRLRRNQLEGLKFKRQFPIPPYIVDFICEEKRLIVEVDGGGHNGSARDQKRDAFLTRHGYRVLRVWSNEVLANVEGVADAILNSIAAPARKNGRLNK